MVEELQVLMSLAADLKHLEIPYMVSGSMALNYYAVPRMTRDIDVVGEITATNVEEFVRTLSKTFFVDDVMVRSELKKNGMFNIIHQEYLVKVDFICRKQSAYDEAAFSRRRMVIVEGQEVSLITPEDLILAKLRWAQKGSSELQMRDVRSILKSTPDLDLTYMEQWAAKLGLSDLFEQARDL